VISNPDRYGGQRIFVRREDYVYLVLFVERASRRRDA
jgi:hypothetical protein